MKVVVDVFDDDDFFPLLNKDEFVDQFILTSINESPSSFRGIYGRSVTVSQLPSLSLLNSLSPLQGYHHCFPHSLLQSGLLWRRYVHTTVRHAGGQCFIPVKDILPCLPAACDVYCVANTTHTCGPDGSWVCVDGWTGDTCDTCVPHTDCCELSFSLLGVDNNLNEKCSKILCVFIANALYAHTLYVHME